MTWAEVELDARTVAVYHSVHFNPRQAEDPAWPPRQAHPSHPGTLTWHRLSRSEDRRRMVHRAGDE
jgi:hypothetical protein